jgi:adenylate cyclase
MSDPFWWNRAYLAAAHAQLGEMEMAAREAKEVLRVRPNFSISWYLLQEPYKNATDAEPLREGLRKAGFPE